MSEMESGERLSIDDVDKACMALDAYEDAIVRARKGSRGRQRRDDSGDSIQWPEPAQPKKVEARRGNG